MVKKYINSYGNFKPFCNGLFMRVKTKDEDYVKFVYIGVFFFILKLIFALAIYDGLLSIDIWYFLIFILIGKLFLQFM